MFVYDFKTTEDYHMVLLPAASEATRESIYTDEWIYREGIVLSTLVLVFNLASSYH